MTRTCAAAEPLADLFAARRAAPALVAFALFVLSRPYLGLDGDARLYFGRAFADADPHGVGADFYFAANDQFGFSVFSALTRPVVLHLGPSTAGLLLAGLATLCCFAALVFFAGALTRRSRRATWLIVVFVTMIPASFDIPSMFEFAEPLAVPRPFAEAAVLAALACLVEARPVASLAFVALALALHPIMGAVGAAVLAFGLLARAAHPVRAALVAVAALAALTIAAALFHLSLGTRLLQRMDDAWLALVVERSPHLFTSRWAPSEIANLLVQAASIAVAARGAAPRARTVLLAILVAGLGAVAVAALMGDALHDLLFIQAQLWRSVWLLSLAGAAALALRVAALPRQNDGERLALALLALGWVLVAQVWLALGCAVGALALCFDARLNARVARRHLVVLGLAATTILASTVGAAMVPAPGHDASFGAALLARHAEVVPVLVLAGWWALRPGAPGSPRRDAPCAPIAVCAALALDVAALALWNDRDIAQIALERPRAVPSFDAAAAGRAPEVFWVDGGSESWFALGRPQWLSHLQANGLVFSRPLAFEWRRRADIAFAAGLARPSLLRRAAAGDDLAATPASVAAFCARRDAPGTIVMRWRPNASPRLPGTIWRPDPGSADAYEIIACAAPAPGAPATKAASTAAKS